MHKTTTAHKMLPSSKHIKRAILRFLFATCAQILCIDLLFTGNPIQVTSAAANNLPPTPPILGAGLLSPLNPLFIEANKLYQSQITNATSNAANNNININIPSTGTNNANKTSVNQLLKQLQLKATRAPQVPLPASTNLSSMIQPQQQQQSSPKPLSRLASQLPGGNFSLAAVRKRWRQMESSVGNSLTSLGQQLRLKLEELAQQRAIGSLTSGCRSALNELADGLASQRLWASQTVDASARLPSGLLEGTLTELGHFDQCLGLAYQLEVDTANVRGPRQQPAPPTTGQYCTIQIKPPLIPRPRLHTICQRLPALSAPAPGSGLGNYSGQQTTSQLLSQNSQNFYYAGLRLGLCTPSKCQKSDVQLLLTAYLAKFDLFGQVKSCQVLGDQVEFDFVQICIISALVCLVVLVGLGTIVDLSCNGPGKSHLEEQAANDAAIKSSSRSRHLGAAQAVANDSGSSSSGSDNQQLASDGHRAPNGKRWLYQVYRSPLGVCQLHRPPLSQPGLQRNPLAMDPGTGCDLATGESLEGHILGGQFTKLHSSSSQHLDQCHLELDGAKGFAAAETDSEAAPGQDGIEVEVDEEEEAWIAELEMNQAKSNDIAALGNRRLAQTNRKASMELERESQRGFRCIIKSILLCFSLRTNLRLISRHVATPSAKQRQPANKYHHHHRHCLSANEQATTSNKDTTTRNELADIKVIHGLRTITMIWIIFGHTIGLVNPEMMNNLFVVAQLSCSSRLLQALLNATLAVNTFFMISGLVTVVSLVRKCSSANRLLLGANGSRRTEKQEASRLDAGEISSMGSLSSVGSSMGSSNRCINGAAATTAATPTTSGPRKQRRGQQKRAPRAKEASKGSGGRSSRANSVSGSQVAGWPSDFQPLAWLAMRYLRLTPAYAAVIGVSILVPNLGSGPFWQESAGQLGPACRDNWWSNLVYANNFINTDRLCLIHSWYLSNDWQFFLVTIFLLTIGYRSRRLALLLAVSLLLGSSAATFALTVANDLPPTIVSTSPAVAERWLFIHSLYYKPWPHLSSYLVGLLTGYLLLIKDRIKLTRAARACAWLVFTMLALALLNSIYPWNMGLQVEPLLTGLHSATFRTLWATCCAWLVFALATRPQASLSKLLAWHGFQVSSRLTYCAYLVHPIIIYYHFGTLRERMDASVYGQFHRFVATLGLSYLFALLLSLLVESPSIQLQRLIVSTLGGARASAVKSEGSQAAGYRHRNCSTCSGGTNDSWIGTSSFGEQSSATGSNLALVNGTDQLAAYNSNSSKPKLMMMSGILAQPIGYFNPGDGSPQKVLSAAQQQLQSQVPASWATAINDTPGAPAMDADFQHKLAQAIGRGFRIRSKLANGTIRPSSLAQAAAPQVNRKVPEDTQVKKRLSTGAVPTPIVAVERRASEVANAEGPIQSADQLAATMTQQFTQPRRPSSCLVDPRSRKTMEFSTFFLGQQQQQQQQPPPDNHSASQSQQIALAAANYQRRRSHDLNLMANRTSGHARQYHQQQQVRDDANEFMLMKQRQESSATAATAALLTRSQNQLDQFNPRNGLGQI